MEEVKQETSDLEKRILEKADIKVKNTETIAKINKLKAELKEKQNKMTNLEKQKTKIEGEKGKYAK